MVSTIARQLEDKKFKSQLSRQQNVTFAKTVNERVSEELMAIEHKKDLKHQ